MFLESLGFSHLSNSSKLQGKHEKVRFLSSPLKNQRFSDGFSHFWPVPSAFCAYPCMPMAAGTAPGELVVLCAALDPKNISVSRASESPESSPNSRFSKEIMWFCSGGAGFEHSRAGSSAGRCVVSCRAKNRRLIRACRRRAGNHGTRRTHGSMT